jgi:hypothetical protein
MKKKSILALLAVSTVVALCTSTPVHAIRYCPAGPLLMCYAGCAQRDYCQENGWMEGELCDFCYEGCEEQICFREV